jgi:hypothetical protein
MDKNNYLTCACGIAWCEGWEDKQERTRIDADTYDLYTEAVNILECEERKKLRHTLTQTTKNE